MKKLTFHILAILAIALTGLINNSCTHKEFDELPVPTVCPSDTFQISTPFGASTVSPDFSIGDTVWFTATFNESVKWKLTVTGASSGAVKNWEGEGASVNQYWLGRANHGSDFFTDENVVAKFEVQCQAEVTVNLSIIANTWLSNGFYLWGDFDAVIPTGPYNYPVAPAVVTGGPSETTSIVDPSPAGGNYHHLQLTSPQDVWFLGGYGANATINVGTNDPNEIYCSFFVNSNGITNTDIQLVLRESGVFKLYRRTADFLGWKMLSFKLADIGVVDPSNIDLVEFGLGSAPLQGKIAELNVDFVIFTRGEPFYTDPVSVDGGPFLGE